MPAWLPRRRVEWGAVLAGALLAVPAFALLAPLPALEEQGVLPGTVILDARGGLIEQDTARGLRIPVDLDEVAPAVLDATVAAEDQRFWSHPGVDPLAMVRALVNLRSAPSGASTITQQLVRGTYLEGTALPLPLRKAREAVQALALEARTSKEEVLEAYLNHVYYGRGAYGIEAAAQAYFGVGAGQVDLAQAAFLAGLPRSPVEYDSSEDAARDRQRYVLDRMVATGVIDRAGADGARDTVLNVVPPEPRRARHVSAVVYEELRSVLPDAADLDGLVIETTIDPALQRTAERSVDTRLALIERHRAGSAAVVALDPRDGRLLTLVGSADFDAPTGQIDMSREPRQPGSALKPLLYALALERGYTPASMLLDVPTTFTTDGGPYRPANYDLAFRGPVPLRVALASSLNVPAVRMLDALGVDALVEMAHRAGLSSLDAAEAYGLSLTLGGGGVRLVDLAAAYGAFAAEGLRYRPWVIERVRDHAGRVLYEHGEPSPVRVVDPVVAYLVADMLSDPSARIPGFGPESILNTTFGAAVKTGTSSEYRDNWTIGFTPERVVGVWVGNPDQTPMVDVSGVEGAAPIWRDVMTTAAAGFPDAEFAMPEGIVTATVCAPTGLLPGPDCPAPITERFIEGTEPSEAESYYHCAGLGLAIDPPAEARPWAMQAGWALWSEPGASESVRVVQPADGSVLFPAIEAGGNRMLLRASVPPSAERVEFYVNGQPAGTATAAEPFAEWVLEAGMHQVRVVVDLANGDRAEDTAAFEVRAR